MSKSPRRVAVVNTIGSIGYMFLVATWAFFAAIIVGLVFEASNKLNATIPMQPAVTPPQAEPSMAATVAGYVLAGVALLVTLAIMVALPYLIGKWGSRVVRRLMAVMRIDMTRTQLFLVKGLLATVPLAGLITINFVYMPESVTFGAMYIATVAVAAVAIGLFFVQLLTARRFHVSVEKTW